MKAIPCRTIDGTNENAIVVFDDNGEAIALRDSERAPSFLYVVKDHPLSREIILRYPATNVRGTSQETVKKFVQNICGDVNGNFSY